MSKKQKAMDAARKNVEVEKEQVEDQFKEFDRLVATVPVDFEGLEVLLDTLDFQINDYTEMQKVYLEHLRTNNLDDDYKAQLAERNEVRKRRLLVGNKASKLFTAGAGSSTASGSSTSADNYRLRLPKRELQKFDGDVRNWRSFWASFQEIDVDRAMPDIEKYHYLLQAMSPGSRPHQVVSSYPADGPSYKLAKDELADKFGKTKTIIKVYMRDLIKLAVDANVKDKKYNFTEMVTALTAQTRNLEQLGLTHDKYGMVLYPIVESCIPQEVLGRYLMTPGVKEEIQEILLFLNEEVRRQDETMLAYTSFAQVVPQDKSGKGNKPTKGGSTVTTPTAVTFFNSDRKNACAFCGGKHDTSECRKAVTMTREAKTDALRESRRCFRCLQSGHSSKFCKVKNLVCFKCSGGHHTLMCWEESKSRDKAKEKPHKKTTGKDETGTSSASGVATEETQEKSTTQMANFIRKPEVLLQTMSVRVRHGNSFKVVRVMLDSGSQCTYVRKALAQELELPFEGMEQVVHQTFGAVVSKPVEHPVYKVEVSGLHAPYLDWFGFRVSAIEDVAKAIVAPPEGVWLKECGERGIKLCDPVGVAKDIDLLIGNDIAPYLLVGQRSFLLPSHLVARESKLGWFLEGKIKGSENLRSSKAMMCVNMQLSNLDVTQLWSLEVLGITDAAESRSRKELETAAMEHFNSTVSQAEDGRYVVHLPWIEGHPDLPDNKSHAIARLHATTKDLLRDKRLTDYHEIFMKWLSDGIIETVPDVLDGPVNYLPHRAVYKEGSTTPVRPVFNASAKLKNHPSLNECLEIGPNLLEKIPSVLCNFRVNAVGVISDIEKAFLQIEVAKQDRNFMVIVWWADINDRKKLVMYRHRRVVFGVSSSPFLLCATIQHLLDKNSKQFKTAVNWLRNGFYVDNVVTSLPSLEEARQFQDEATKLLATGRFNLRGWEFAPSLEEKVIPVLGLLWNTKRDVLHFDVSKLLKKTDDTTVTKRTVLMHANSLFDPLGWLSPFTIAVKMLFKRVCGDQEKFGWDADLPEDYQRELRHWVSQLELVPQIHIPRCVGIGGTDRKLLSVHCFCDASKQGYATCIYLRIDTVPVRVHLLGAKARVTPDKVLTIPRGELLACLIGARYTNEIQLYLGLEDIPVTFWSDSTTALSWIRRLDAVWGVFVNNRVKEIRELTIVDNWRHVPGVMNPADFPSRGCSLEKLIALKWWEGPDWLHDPDSTFPNADPAPEEDVVNVEKRKTVVSAMLKVAQPHFVDGLVRLGDYHVILRVIAYAKRFLVNKFQRKTVPTRSPIPGITVDELAKAEVVLIRHIQESTWGGKPPNGFQLERDDDNILRLVTRLVNGKGEDGFKKPALLPGGNPIVELLIYKEHSLACHAGVQFLQAKLREKYWITCSRRTIGNVIHKCPVCRVHLAKRCRVPEAPLPLNRVETGRCFQVVGVDLAGPLFLKDGKKVWIVIFTCAVYRAVHLEIVSSQSTQSFLNALRKFVARRGRPETVYSDNGTNFHGANNLMSKLDWKLIEQHVTVREIKWIFNPPTAAWWGGFWERLIGMMKQLLRRVIGKRTVFLEELEVLIAEAESVMNERPLTYVSEDSSELRPLSPVMFMRDLPTSCLPEIELDGTELNRRFRYCLRMKKELRRRFRTEYLGQLIGRGKSQRVRQLSLGDVVLVEIDNKKRLEWPIGVVLEMLPGKDGYVRTVKVKTTNGVILRPVQRLFPLELESENVAPLPMVKKPDAVPEESPELSDDDDGISQLPEIGEPEPVAVSRFGRRIKKTDRFSF